MTLVAASTHASVRLPMACELYGVSYRSLVIGRVMSIVFLCLSQRRGGRSVAAIRQVVAHHLRLHRFQGQCSGCSKPFFLSEIFQYSLCCYTGCVHGGDYLWLVIYTSPNLWSRGFTEKKRFLLQSLEYIDLIHEKLQNLQQKLVRQSHYLLSQRAISSAIDMQPMPALSVEIVY